MILLLFFPQRQRRRVFAMFAAVVAGRSRPSGGEPHLSCYVGALFAAGPAEHRHLDLRALVYRHERTGQLPLMRWDTAPVWPCLTISTLSGKALGYPSVVWCSPDEGCPILSTLGCASFWRSSFELPQRRGVFPRR